MADAGEARTVALLLTDVVDSTKLAERLGDQGSANLWVAHDRVARDLLAEHHGREIDKTDGFLLMFDQAADAVDYALAYHQAVSTLDPPIQARAGMHVGQVVLIENAAEDVERGAKPLDIEGVAKPMAARVMSVAMGGQTLATPEAVEALGLRRVQAEPDGHVGADGLVALSHGHWRLKGVSQPVELFEVGVRGEAPFTPPPDSAKVWRVHWHHEAWVPIREVKHHLPAERDAFVGRTSELQRLAATLDEGARLVSVLGIGGTGKTRLALHYGWTWLGGWPGGVWFCDLSEARTVDGIAHAVATALDVPLGKDPIVQLGHAIAGRGRCLVVLDNFEQVARHAAETLGHWLDRASDAQFMVTTREVLGLPGETSLPLPPLGAGEAEALFDARARQAKPAYVPMPDVVGELVRLLDGLPLAIELAAARVRVMAPDKLLARIGDRFRLLTSTGGRRDRHATLRATLDWSWELLTAEEQTALAQLSVFEGGFTLVAAEAVLEAGDAWPTDLVQSLVDKSLVRQADDERFDMLVSVQQYAGERLEALGQRAEAEARHGAYYAQFGAADAREALGVHGGTARRRALAQDLDNLVVACRRAVARADAEVAVATLQAAWAVLELQGLTAAGADLAGAVAAVDDLPPTQRATVHGVQGRSLWRLGRMDEARAHYDAALAVHREVGNRRSEGNLLNSLGNLHRQQSHYDEARAHYDAALAVHSEVGDRRSEGMVLGNLGLLHLVQGRPAAARAHYDAALTVHREVGNRRSEGNVLGNLGNLHLRQGHYDEARAHYDAALAVHSEVGDRRFEGNAVGNLGIVHAQQGRPDEARAHYDAALALHREVGNRRFEGIVLSSIGDLQMDQGRHDEARAYYGAALAVHREVGNRRFEGIVLGNIGNLDARLGRHDAAMAQWEEGITLLREVGDPLELANLLTARAAREAAFDPPAARTHLDEAEALASELQVGPDSELGKLIAEARAALPAESASEE